MKEHSINVLPKWARERIMRLEREVAELRLYPLELTAVKVCTVTTKYNGENYLPIHLCAGDKVRISQPTLKLHIDNDFGVPKTITECARKDLAKYIPHEAIIHVQWEKPS